MCKLINDLQDKYPKLFKNGKIDEKKLSTVLDVGYNLVFNSADNKLENKIKMKDDIIQTVQTTNLSLTNQLAYISEKLDTDGIQKKIDKMDTLFENFIGISSGSNRKGEVSENFVYELFTKLFKNYSYDKKRHIAHNADGELNSPTGMSSLVEIKNYSSSVRKEEVDKMIYDMKYCNKKLGLFLSLKSNIIGHSNISHMSFIHNKEEYNLVLISKAFESDSKIESGVMLLEIFHKLQQNYDGDEHLEQVKDKVISQLKKLNKISCKISKLNDKFLSLEKIIRSEMDDFYKDLREHEYEYKKEVNEIWLNVLKEFNVKKKELVKVNSIDEICEKYKKDKNHILLMKSLILFNKKKITFYDGKKKNEYYIKHGEKEICKLNKGKEKIIYEFNSPKISLIFNNNCDNKTEIENMNFLKHLLSLIIN